MLVPSEEPEAVASAGGHALGVGGALVSPAPTQGAYSYDSTNICRLNKWVKRQETTFFQNDKGLEMNKLCQSNQILMMCTM